MDIHGNFTSHGFSIDITTLLPAAKPISIPDANLAAAVREALNLAPGTVLTSYTMLELTHLDALNRQITDLTGLEYAHNLNELWISAELVNGAWVSSNAISDLSPIEELTQLSWLMLANPSRAAVSALPGITQLRVLEIWWKYPISNLDVSAFAGLTQLESIAIKGLSISDVSPLAGLIQLGGLGIWNTSVSDISALVGLRQLYWVNLRPPLSTNLSTRTFQSYSREGLWYTSIIEHIQSF